MQEKKKPRTMGFSSEAQGGKDRVTSKSRLPGRATDPNRWPVRRRQNYSNCRPASRCTLTHSRRLGFRSHLKIPNSPFGPHLWNLAVLRFIPCFRSGDLIVHRRQEPQKGKAAFGKRRRSKSFQSGGKLLRRRARRERRCLPERHGVNGKVFGRDGGFRDFVHRSLTNAHRRDARAADYIRQNSPTASFDSAR